MTKKVISVQILRNLLRRGKQFITIPITRRRVIRNRDIPIMREIAEKVNKYKVASCSKVHVKMPENDLFAARELRDKYGLGDFYSLEEIYAIWREYSESFAAGWLIDDKESVERAFGMELEEVKEENSVG